MNETLYDLTAPQKSILFTEEYYKGSSINTNCGTAMIDEKLDFDLLKQSVNFVIEHNDSLRTHLCIQNNEMKQFITDYQPIEFEIIDVETSEELAKIEQSLANHNFDLSSDLFMIKLFRFPDGHGGFIIDAHHIISDSWTHGFLAKQIIATYSCLVKNEEPNFDAISSYIDYIKSEIEYKKSDKFNKDRQYWNSIFETIPEVASIPSTKGSSDTFCCTANRLMKTIDQKEMARINEFCKDHHVSVFNFFMAIYSIYIGRVSNLDDFVIGTPILNRTNFKEKNTAGMFINVVPFRMHLEDNVTFSSFVTNVAKDSLAMLRHQKYSYQYILEDLRKQDASLPNLYNTIISYQITKTNIENGLNYKTTWTFNGTCGDDLDIHIYDLNDEGSVHIAYDYRVDKYSMEEITAIHNRLLHMIHQVLHNKEICIHDLFEEQVEKTPDNIAVVFENQSLTYRELNEKANQLARYLVQNDVKIGDIIGISMTKRPELLISTLAVLKIGACYVPIDSNYPSNRIQYILEESKSTILLTTSDMKYTSKIAISIDKILHLSTFESSNLNCMITPKNLAYIIYTSGSTGKPKGVTICHNSLVNYIYWASCFYCNKQPVNFPLYSSFAFDLTVTSIYTPLITGGRIIVYDDTDILLTLRKIFSDGISNIIKLTPAHLSLVQELDCCNTKITKMIVGGDILPQETCKKITNKFENISIFNEYGPTEATVGCMIYQYNSSDINYHSVPIGVPINNVSIYILDKNLNLLPNNCKGEIYIGGDCLSLGYHDKKLNQNKFINSPFHDTEFLYKTNDIAILHKENILEYIGRNDSQIKLNGFRIEIGEIIKNTLKFDNIKDCFIDVYDFNDIKTLCGFYVSDINIDTDNLKSFLHNYIPDYMIPKLWTKLDFIPLTINGKVNKSQLPIPTIITDNNTISIRNDMDASILKYINELLNSNITNLNCNLFDIGFDSLLAIKLALKLSQDYNFNLSAKDIFEHPYVQDLSDYISTLSKNGCTNTILKVKKELYYPLSNAQKRIYYASNLDTNSTLYNIAGGIIVNNLLDIQKVQNCFNILINRHEALRTHFEIKDNDIVQVVEDKINFNLEIDTKNTNNLNDIYTNFVKPFDLSKAPLFRTKLVTLEDNRMLLLLDMHHIISDGTSLAILLQELCDLYNGSTLPEKQIDYTDFTLWEKEQFKTSEFNEAKQYWVNQFKDEIPLLNMPTSYPRPSSQNFKGANYHVKLSKEIFDKVNKISKQLNITPYMLMLSCYYILLSKYTSQDDIVIGTPIMGRSLPELNSVLGMFVNTLALRNKIDSSLSFDQFSQTIKENCINSFNNQCYPFDCLVKDLNIKRDTSRNSLFDIMFVYQNNGYPKINFTGIDVKYFIPDNDIAKFDLTLEVIPVDNEYVLRFEYCTKLFDEDFIQRLSSHYINILNVILENTNIKIADVDMLSKEETHQILYDFNDTKTDYPKDTTIAKLFEEQVEKTPDKIAVVFENQILTYRELNQKANQLANFLIDNNITLGDTVCILLDKSLEMIVSILSILKVGATFLPIDINYPKERIDYIINDSKAKILLTTQNFINKANYTVPILNIDLNNVQYLKYPTKNINIIYSTDNLAYVMYTSGSTGKPKGVMVTHKNVLRLVKNNKFIAFSKDEHILQTGSIVFDACTFEIWGALLNGFELYIIKKELLLDAVYLKEYVKKNKITSLFITTQLFNQLIDVDIEIFSSIKNVLTGGEEVSVKHMNMLNLHNRNINIIHCYGPTENTTFSTCYNVKKEKYVNTIPIGKPISNSTAYIVSNLNQLCPIDVPGELYVGGDGVAKGYLNNEKLTLEKFIQNPFGNDIIYKTGDLAKWLPDGNIEFIGRIDNQVKVRGFRIELSEIDLKILEYPNINYATTILSTINNEKVICSYFVANTNIDLVKLKDFLKISLPSYMIPTYMLQLEKFEMNINGKIDRNSLPTNFEVLKNLKTIEEPKNKLEQQLLDIYKKITTMYEIGVTHNLFDDLNCDSLIAMKIQIEAMSNNINIPYSDIFKYPTVRSLSKHLIEKRGNNQAFNSTNFVNYRKYDSMLINNTLENPLEIVDFPISNVLLTGFTGFLGAHILDSFLKKETGTIYCLIRNKNNMSAKERLINVLHFYFGDKYDKFIGNRIRLVEGDIAFDDFGLSKKEYIELGEKLSIVIHSAALVKHYGMYEDFKNANITGTQHIVDFTTNFNIKLLHISTLSVSGNNFADGSYVENNFDSNVDFAENNFYIGQNVEGLYAKSKFEAERIVLDAIYNSNLQASILRMGNLTSRFSEGKFQQNHFENAFVNRFKSFLQIGCVPEYMLKLYAEFTPIDYCGDAIIEIARHFNPKYSIFHLMNEKRVYLDRLFEIMKCLNIDISIVSEQEFIKIINTLLADENKKMYIEGIINDFDKNNKHLIYESNVKVQSKFSTKYLERLGFTWPYIDINYIRNYFKYLENIGYLNIKIK